LINRGEYVSPEALQAVMDMGMLQGITETWDRLEKRLEELKK
ncbi:MAG TPA: SRPBCC domain-containing protein, partial [Paenibacillus sp.]|nr:SRPBCC domain-containing protein [Paenibacillus sp.]